MNHLNRRTFLKASGSLLGAAAGARLLGPIGEARAAEKNVVVNVYFQGGYNPIFASADSFLGKGGFGVTNSNIVQVGGGIFVDKDTIGTFPKFALDHMATVGVHHGITSHFSVENAIMIGGKENYAMTLASALGGNAAIKAVFLGQAGAKKGFPSTFPPPVGGISLQHLRSLSAAAKILGGSGADLSAPNAEISTAALDAMGQQSGRDLSASPTSLSSYKEALDTGLDALKKPVAPFSVAALRTAYGLSSTQDQVDNYPAKFATAELMIRAGANVINILDHHTDGGVGVPWDFHLPTSGDDSRRRMKRVALAPIRTFLDRMLNLEGYNVVVALFGDFGRFVSDKQHAPNLSATVMGKYVKQGTTGKVSSNGLLDRGTTPPIKEFWSYLADAAKISNNPFGTNKHRATLLL